MNIDTNKLVDILKNDQPLSVMVVEEHGIEKLVCLFALPHLTTQVTDFGKSILEHGKTECLQSQLVDLLKSCVWMLNELTPPENLWSDYGNILMNSEALITSIEKGENNE